MTTEQHTPSKITAVQLAAMISGRQYGDEVTTTVRDLAISNNLLILHGASDDLLEFSGAMHDEVGAWNGATVWLSPDREILDEHAPGSIKIEAVWCPDGIDTSWLIKADAPSAGFAIKEDDDDYCHGIVIDLDEAFKPAPAEPDPRDQTISDLLRQRDELLAIVTMFEAHYPAGINPFLDEAWRAALAYFARAGEVSRG